MNCFPVALRLAVVGCIAALVGCSKPESAAQPSPPPQQVTVIKAAPQSVPIISERVGQTQSVQTVEIRSRVDGTVEKIGFEEGRIINQGDLMFVIDRRPFEAALAQAKANLMQARAAYVKSRQELTRIRPLAKEDAVSQQELEAAVARESGDKAAVEAAEAALSQAKLNLEYTTIRAPITGLVGSTEVRVGSLVTQRETLLATISDLDPIYVTFSVPERAYLAWAKQHPKDRIGGGDAAKAIEFKLILADDWVYPHQGSFDFADRNVDPKTGTLRLRVKFPNPEQILRPGQFVRVRYAARENPDAILVPQRAIQEIQGKRSVYVVGPEGKAQFREVTTGARAGNDVIIEKGLQPGDTVIVDGAQKIRPGAPVNPVPLAAESKPPSQPTVGSPG